MSEVMDIDDFMDGLEPEQDLHDQLAADISDAVENLEGPDGWLIESLTIDGMDYSADLVSTEDYNKKKTVEGSYV